MQKELATMAELDEPAEENKMENTSQNNIHFF